MFRRSLLGLDVPKIVKHGYRGRKKSKTVDRSYGVSSAAKRMCIPLKEGYPTFELTLGVDVVDRIVDKLQIDPERIKLKVVKNSKKELYYNVVEATRRSKKKAVDFGGYSNAEQIVEDGPKLKKVKTSDCGFGGSSITQEVSLHVIFKSKNLTERISKGDISKCCSI